MRDCGLTTDSNYSCQTNRPRSNTPRQAKTTTHEQKNKIRKSWSFIETTPFSLNNKNSKAQKLQVHDSPRVQSSEKRHFIRPEARRPVSLYVSDYENMIGLKAYSATLKAGFNRQSLLSGPKSSVCVKKNLSSSFGFLN
jgi:hypothetical protein